MHYKEEQKVRVSNSPQAAELRLPTTKHDTADAMMLLVLYTAAN
jgi:hypothetical protein